MLKYLNDVNSSKTFEESKLKIFICTRREVYPSLVKMLNSNIYFTNEIIYSEVRKHMLFPPLEEFVDILDLPHDEPHFKSDEPEVGNNYMYKSVASSFLLNPY